MWQAMEMEKEAPKIRVAGLFKDASIAWRTFLAVTIMVMQQATGINFFINYSTTILEGMGMNNPLTICCLFNGTQVIGILLGIYLIDSNSKFGGRRNMFVMAALLMAFPMLIAAVAVAENWASGLIVVMVLIY